MKKVFLEILLKFTCELIQFAWGLQKETLAQVFPCEFSEIFKNTYFEEHLRIATSDYLETSQ